MTCQSAGAADGRLARDVVRASPACAPALRYVLVERSAALRERFGDRVEIVGTTGRITFATFDDRPIVLERQGVETPFVVPHPPHVQQPLIQTIVDELLGRGRCPSTGESGARTTAIMDRLLRSYYAR